MQNNIESPIFAGEFGKQPFKPQNLPLQFSADAVNAVVRGHVVQAIDWDRSERSAILHEWVERFNQRFFSGRLPPIFLSFDRTHATVLGHYVPGRDGAGLVAHINLNAIYLGRPLAEVLEVLLHELTHLWQERFGRPGRGSYHNKEFVARAAQMGLLVALGRGHSNGVTDPFVSFLRQCGVDAEAHLPPTAEEAAVKRVRGQSRLCKWSCRCTKGGNVWVARGIRLKARCCVCKTRFSKAGDA